MSCQIWFLPQQSAVIPIINVKFQVDCVWLDKRSTDVVGQFHSAFSFIVKLTSKTSCTLNMIHTHNILDHHAKYEICPNWPSRSRFIRFLYCLLLLTSQWPLNPSPSHKKCHKSVKRLGFSSKKHHVLKAFTFDPGSNIQPTRCFLLLILNMVQPTYDQMLSKISPCDVTITTTSHFGYHSCFFIYSQFQPHLKSTEFIFWRCGASTCYTAYGQTLSSSDVHFTR